MTSTHITRIDEFTDDITSNVQHKDYSIKVSKGVSLASITRMQQMILSNSLIRGRPSATLQQLLAALGSSLLLGLLLQLQQAPMVVMAQSSPPPPSGMTEYAAGRAAFQSSDWSRTGLTTIIPATGVVAAKAVDGRVHQNGTSDPYCAHTNLDVEPWW